MRRRTLWGLAAAVWAALFILSCLPARTSAGKLPNPWAKPRDCVQELAAHIDALEKHLETYGSVTAKQADVWGQARLTKHRVEYEKTMYNMLDKFQQTINAAVFRSDQAFLSTALALQAAAIHEESTLVQAPPATAPATAAPPPALTPAPAIPPPDHPFEKPRETPPTPTLLVGTAQGGVIKSDGIGTEPTVTLDEMSRYINYLHELRRINEGDDTSDSPGYALHLIRLPVSVLPGSKTREGYGAEITFTADPYLSEELLPMTFRSLVINDLAEQLALPILTLIESGKVEAIIKAENEAQQLVSEMRREALRAVDAARKFIEQDASKTSTSMSEQERNSYSDANDGADIQKALKSIMSEAQGTANEVAHSDPSNLLPEEVRNRGGFLTDMQRAVLMEALGKVEKINSSAGIRANNASAGGAQGPAKWEYLLREIKESSEAVGQYENERAVTLLHKRALLASAANDLLVKAFAGVSVARSRRAQYAVPACQFVPVFGSEQLVQIALCIQRSQARHVQQFGMLHLPDVEIALQDELQAAYDFLSTPDYAHLWSCYCTPQLNSSTPEPERCYTAWA